MTIKDKSRRQILLGIASLAAPASAWAQTASPQAAEPLRSFRIPSASMEPTLMVGDQVLTRWTGRPGAPPLRRADVVIFHHEDRYWVKRLIGLPGDSVLLRKSIVVVNGAALPRTPEAGGGTGLLAITEQNDGRRYRIQQQASIKKAEPEGRTMEQLIVPQGEVFVMGDNRDNSYDSRFFGPIAIADIRFIALQILMSPTWSRIGMRLDRDAPLPTGDAR